MDSDEDYDVEDSGDALDYEGEDDMSSDGEGYDFDAGGEVHTCRKVPYRVLARDDVVTRQAETVSNVTSVLGIPEEEAARVLRKFKWESNRVNEEWFQDTDAIRKAVGLVDEQPEPSCSTATCGICFDALPLSEMRSAACKHYYCRPCWQGYLSNAISEGPACLDVRCPHPECKPKACVPIALIKEVVSPDEFLKYGQYRLRSFVEENCRMCWCVGARCDNAIECLDRDRSAGDALDVMCSCSEAFCFNCKEQAHRPVKCETVRQWVTKNSAESENLVWILANTRPCPKCKRPIEKNQGCMHMTCSQCRFEFCWLCQGSWAEHGERTGGFYNCNRYAAVLKKGEMDDEVRRRENAKQSLERYMHYFERWDAHSRAREKARVDAGKISDQWFEKLSDATNTPTSQLKFIQDAWQQIIECRRILKWTYAYGYYEFQEEMGKNEKAPQRQFFEFIQGEAEGNLERLHEMAEKELKKIVDMCTTGGAAAAGFQEFRKNLIGLTDVVHGFFDRLVKALEHGFDTLDEDYAAQAGPSTTNDAVEASKAPTAAATSSAATAATNKRAKRTRGTAGANQSRGAVAEGAGGDPSRQQLLAEQGFWSCTACTFNNTDLGSALCEVCGHPRDGE